jgi:hypothetical protein
MPTSEENIPKNRKIAKEICSVPIEAQPKIISQGNTNIPKKRELLCNCVSYWGPLRGAVLVATASAFLAVGFSAQVDTRRIRKQIRRGYQSYFFAPSN